VRDTRRRSRLARVGQLDGRLPVWDGGDAWYLQGNLADKTVLGYACTSHGPGAGIACARGETTVAAVANH
jgi:hypothetical protein